MAKVLVVGSGGREHALALGLARSPSVAQVLVGGVVTPHAKITELAEPLPSAHAELAAYCSENKINLVVVGPEQPLADGLVDDLLAAGIPAFGPSQKAAELESSKAYAKAFMQRHNVPTGRFRTLVTATQLQEALDFVASAPYAARVVKACGLAAGKGVVVASNVAEAQDAIRAAAAGAFGPTAAAELVVEELLTGPEVSLLAFCDGEQAVLMPAAQDHKRLLDGNNGPNTGGMGAYAPCPLLDAAALAEIEKSVFVPTLRGMAAEGRPYHGVLYAGLMLTPDGPRVLEFNCRFGDPETQSLVALMEGDLYQTMLSCVPGHTGQLRTHGASLFSTTKSAVNVVLASGGYPGDIKKGLPITGLNAQHQIDGAENVLVFHAGAAVKNGQLVTSGGRVMSVCTTAATLREAVDAAYHAARRIQFEGMQFRRDIAYQALSANDGLTYAAAGVDIDAGDALVDAIKPHAKRTSRKGCNADLGGYGGVFDLREAGFTDPILISGTDGVGTKLKVAIAANIHTTVGIDLVAMSVNDILTQGAEPLYFLDYLATGKLTIAQLADVVKGVADGCVQSGCALMGGETAEMPGMYAPGDYDVAGFAVGAVERTDILPRMQDLRAGDVILGLASSGVHSNGFSLVRRIVQAAGLKYSDPCPFDVNKTLGEALLEPTIIYVKQLMPLIKARKVKALAHITGSGLPGNIPRVLPENLAAVLDAAAWPMLDVFKWMAAVGRVAPEEMARTFNLGIGMVVVVDQADANEAVQLLSASGDKVYTVGKLEEKPQGGEQVVINNLAPALRDTRFHPPPRQLRKRVAVLISGTGTNLQALIDAAAKPDYPAEISLVISNKAGVKGLARAEKAGIPAVVVPHENYGSREAFEEAIHQHLVEHNIELVCLAGFMRILTPYLVMRWRGRLLNTHPALLPSFKGAHAVKLALEAGVTITGCTVHFVEVEVDAGAIVLQRAVNVELNDTEDTLSERIKAAEHIVYPEALRLVASGEVALNPDGTKKRA